MFQLRAGATHTKHPQMFWVMCVSASPAAGPALCVGVLQLVLITSGPHPDSLQCRDVERKPGEELDACHVWHSGVFEKSAL